MPTNLVQFQNELQIAAKNLPQKSLVALQKKIVLESLRRIVEKTPVDFGHLRLNWQVTIGVPAGAEIPGDGRAPTIGNALTALAGLRPFQVVFVSNPVRYAEILETGGFVPKNPGPSSDPRKGRFGRVLVQGGYSVQAPQGMVAVTVAELLGIFP